MKNKKKILSFVTSLLLLTSCNKKVFDSSNCPITNSTPSVPIEPTPEPENINIFDYAKTAINADETISLISFEGLTSEEKLKVEEIVFPESINGKTLTVILDETRDGIFFGFDNLKRISIPKTVTKIEYLKNNAPYLSSPFINLPNLESITIDSENKYLKVIEGSNCLITSTDNFITANVICGWKDVVIPDVVTNIDSYTFSYNDSITSITLNPNVELKTYAFTYLNNLKSMDLNGNTSYILEKDSKGGVLYSPNITTAGSKIYAAYGDITIPSEFSSLTNSNLYLCNFNSVTSIHLPANFLQLNYTTFSNLPNLENITVDSNVTRYVVPDGSNLLVDVNATSSISPIAAAWKDVVVPDNVTYVTLNNFTSVTSCKLHESVSRLGSYAFSYTKIKSLSLPDSIGSFENNAFYNMNYLETITVGNRITNIIGINNGCIYHKQYSTIYGYYGDVILTPSSVVTNRPFYRSPSVKSIYIPKEITTLPNDFFYGLNATRKIEEYVDVKIDEENPKFKIKVTNNSKCIVEDPDTENETVRFAFPNERGEIYFPNTAKKFNCELDYCTNPKTITSININDGFEDYHISFASGSRRGMDNFINVTKIELPSSIKNLQITGYEFIPFYGLKYLEFISIKGGENDYFKIEGNCLISKQNRYNQDVILLGWGHVEIPRYITSLPRQYALALNDSILSIKMYNNITSIKDSTFFYPSARFDHLEFEGTLADLKSKTIQELRNNVIISILDILNYNDGGYGEYYIYYLDENGNKITDKKVKDLVNL